MSQTLLEAWLASIKLEEYLPQFQTANLTSQDELQALTDDQLVGTGLLSWIHFSLLLYSVCCLMLYVPGRDWHLQAGTSQEDAQIQRRLEERSSSSRSTAYVRCIHLSPSHAASLSTSASCASSQANTELFPSCIRQHRQSAGCRTTSRFLFFLFPSTSAHRGSASAS